MNAMRTCSKCRRELPATSEFFYRDRGGLRSICKCCHIADVCDRQRTSARFGEYQRIYAHENADRKNAAAKAWCAANPERKAANNLAWRRRNPEYEREMKRAYRAANRDKVRLLGRQVANTRRARKAGLSVSKADYQDILTEFGMTCHICGEAIETMSDLHFDHVIPLASGGQHSKDNIRPSHAICNQRKGTRSQCLSASHI